jgi:hypothetical protein
MHVVAADRNVEGLADLARDPGCEVRQVDLETGAAWPLGGGYDAVVVTNYLHRPLFAGLAAALAPGGLLLYETFAQGNERFGKPSSPAFLLAPGELLGAFPTLVPDRLRAGPDGNAAPRRRAAARGPRGDGAGGRRAAASPHRPLNCGFRFSLKARMPSWRSSVGTRRL